LKRAEREELQRQHAVRRANIMRKSRSKADRAAEVSRARDAKYGFVEDYIQEQSGIGIGVVKGVAAVAGAFIAGSLAKRTSKCMGILEQVVERTSVKLESLAESATVTSSTMNSTFEGLNGFFGKIADAVKAVVDVVKSIGGAFWKLILAVLAIVIKAMAAVHTVVADAVVGLLYKLVPDLAPVLEFEDMTVQQDATDLVSKICAAVACFVAPGGSTKRAVFLSIMSRIGTFTRTASGLEGMFQLGLAILEKALNTCLGLIGKPGVRLVGRAAGQVADWCKEVDTIFQKIDTDNPTIGDLNRAKALIVSGYNLKNVMQAPYLRDTLGRHLDKLNARIAAHRGLLEIENTYRQQPIFCMFGGGFCRWQDVLAEEFRKCLSYALRPL
jgi:hypothetical protein